MLKKFDSNTLKNIKLTLLVIAGIMAWLAFQLFPEY
jgi:hypothetical protein